MTRRCETVRLDIAPDGWLQGQWSYATPGPDFAVVFVHGFCSVRYGEKAQALEESCARRGWTFATFDFRGHGESSGIVRDLRGSGLLADLDRVYGFLKENGVSRLCFVGSSMGGWATAWYAIKHPERVEACAHVAPGYHFLTARWDRLSPEEREAWKREGVLRLRNNWVDAELGYGFVEEAPLFPKEQLLRDYHTPTLIFQGMDDEVVPPERTFHFVEQLACPHVELRLYKDGDHRLTDRKEEIAEAACDFFGRWLERGGQKSACIP